MAKNIIITQALYASNAGHNIATAETTLPTIFLESKDGSLDVMACAMVNGFIDGALQTTEINMTGDIVGSLELRIAITGTPANMARVKMAFKKAFNMNASVIEAGGNGTTELIIGNSFFTRRRVNFEK